MSPLEFDTILLQQEGRIATITLNRPERLNALNQEARIELLAAFDRLGRDDSCSVVVLRGAGPAFSSGGDTQDAGVVGSEREIHRGDTAEDWRRGQRNQELLLKIWDLPKPVIAQVHGAAHGWGSLLLTVCDFVLVAEDASIGNARNIMGAGLIGPKYVWALGLRRAKWLDFVPTWRLSGREAVDWGWANLAVPEEKLAEEVAAFASHLAGIPLTHLMFRKASCNRVWEEMGFRSTVASGSEFDALAHMSRHGREIEDAVGREGYLAYGEARDSGYAARHGRS
jgi:enoyl-CoA hydratase